MSLSPTTAASATEQPAAPTPLSAAPSATRRRRTLGRCAHCGKPVDVRDEYVRLYRRAWHLDCALASEPIAAQN